MVNYVCKAIDSIGRVLRTVPFIADDDRRATDQAIVLQLVTRMATGFELWQGGRLILVVQASRPAWRTVPRAPTPYVVSRHRRRLPEAARA